MTTVARPSDASRDALARRASGQPPQTNGGRPTLAQLIERQKPEMARVMPDEMNPDRMARLALTVLRKTPQLNDCTPESFLGSLMTCSQLGLEPSTGQGAEAYLVPHKNKKRNVVECTLIISYQGFAKLFWNSPQAKHLDAQAVFAGDHFEYEYGLEPKLVHRPALSGRGQVIAYYAVAALTSGGSAFVVLSPEDVAAIRGGKVGPSGDIKDPMRWMEKKTALKQLVKLLPKSSTLTQAIKHDGSVRSDPHAEAIDEVPEYPDGAPDVIDAEPVDELRVDTDSGEVDPADRQLGPVEVEDPPADLADAFARDEAARQ